MKRQFVLPVAVALSLHALLLFGFRTGRPSLTAPVRPGTALDPLPPDIVRVEPVPDPDDPAEVNAGSHVTNALPDIVEPPAPDTVGKIPIPASDRVPVTLPTGPGDILGPIEGGDGPGIGTHGPVTVLSSHLDHTPRTRAQIAPVYPYEARLAGRPGEVWVEFTVDESGLVRNPHVLRSTDPVFENPTLQAVAKWRFEPGRKDGRVVRFRMAVPVAFAVNQ